MPLLRITTSARTPETEQRTLLSALSRLIAERLGKPESYVMTAFVPDVSMTFAGSAEPACFVELMSVGRFTPELTRRLSAELCERVEAALGVPKARVYVQFVDAQGHLWGHDGETFE